MRGTLLDFKKDAEQCIIDRAIQVNFPGTNEDLFHFEMKHQEFSFWCHEHRESHSFDLGRLSVIDELLKELK